MPLYGFRGVYIAKRHENNGTVTYDAPITPGCPVRAQLEFQFAEADFWCKDALTIVKRKATGGQVTFEAAYLSDAAKALAFGATAKTRELTYTDKQGTSQTKEVTSVVYAESDQAPYVGFAGYGPDASGDSDDKFTAFFIGKTKFSPPSLNLQTINGSITFQTPTTTGRFMPDGSAGGVIQEVGTFDSEEEARAWCEAVFPQAQTQTPAAGETTGQG